MFAWEGHACSRYNKHHGSAHKRQSFECSLTGWLLTYVNILTVLEIGRLKVCCGLLEINVNLCPVIMIQTESTQTQSTIKCVVLSHTRRGTCFYFSSPRATEIHFADVASSLTPPVNALHIMNQFAPFSQRTINHLLPFSLFFAYSGTKTPLSINWNNHYSARALFLPLQITRHADAVGSRWRGSSGCDF